MIRSLNLLRGFMVMAVLLVIATVASPVMAAQGNKTWVPTYNPGVHVYVDPQLANDPNAPVNFAGLEAEAVRLGQKHGLQVFIVASQMGKDLEASDVPANDFGDIVVQKWQSAPGFPSGDYLLVTWTRRYDNPNKGSVAAQGGSRFSDWHMLGGYFSDKVNGPVTKNLRRFMPQDPQRAFVAIVETVNADIDAIEAQRQAEVDAVKHQQMMNYVYIGGGAFAVLLAIFLALFFRSSSRKTKAKKLIDDWKAKLDPANANYLKLRTSYMGFLTEQADWKKKYKNKTLISYTKACKDFSDFSSRRKRANEMLTEAQKAFDGTGFLGTKGYDEVIALLTTRIVTITGQDLPLEEAKLFDGLVEKTDYLPPKLMDAMAELFDRTNKALKKIVDSFKGAQQNKLDVEQLSAEVDTTRGDIKAAELTMEPYEATIAELKRGQAGFVAVIVEDPESAFEGSEIVEAGFKALEARLRRAISLKGSLPAVKTRIDGSETKATNKRGELAVYAYPLGEGETHVKEALAPKFLLVEKGANPDPIVADARGHLKSAHELVFAGKLDESQTARDEAIALADKASALVDDIMAAKALVEKNVPPARTTFDSLKGEIAPAQTALDELVSDFLADNYPGESDKLKRANAAKGATPGNLSQVKTLYDAQNYVAARALIQSIQGTLNSSRTELTQVHARLKELRRLRQDSRDVLATCQTKVRNLTVKFRENAFTTSEATDRAFATATQRLSTLKTECEKKVADWPKVNADMHAADQSFDGFDSAIDTQATAYRNAKAAVKTLETAIEDAEGYVNNEATLAATRTALQTVNTTFGTLGRRINTAKSDWASIKTDADTAKKAADAAKEQAQAEIQAKKDAKAAITQAHEDIRGVADNTYGYGVTIDLDAANEHYRRANSELGEKDYANAKAQAKAASAAAKKAHEDAEEEESDRRRAAAAAAAAAAAKKNDNGGGPHIGGGGGPIGGGGGGQRGGGDSPAPQIRSHSGGGNVERRGGGDNY